MPIDLTGTWRWHQRGNDAPWEQMGTADQSGTNSLIEVKFEPIDQVPAAKQPADLPKSWGAPWYHGMPTKFITGPMKDGKFTQGVSALGELWAHLLPPLAGAPNVVLHVIRTNYSLPGVDTKKEVDTLRMYFIGVLSDPPARHGAKESYFGHACDNSRDTRIQTFRLYR